MEIGRSGDGKFRRGDFVGSGRGGGYCGGKNRFDGIVRIKRETLNDDVPPALVGDSGFKHLGGRKYRPNLRRRSLSAVGRVGEEGGLLLSQRGRYA